MVARFEDSTAPLNAQSKTTYMPAASSIVGDIGLETGRCIELTRLPAFPATKCGQPPLEYFLHVLHAKKWDKVTILTWSAKESFLNPTYTVLKMMADAGTLGDNVRFFKVGRVE